MCNINTSGRIKVTKCSSYSVIGVWEVHQNLKSKLAVDRLAPTAMMHPHIDAGSNE